jgi:hypothetical protein
MSFRIHTLALAAVCALSALPASASLITGKIAVDNSFALYTGNADGSNLTYIGRNTAHWDVTHTFNFSLDAGQYIYVAAWSDDAAAQGFIGQFDIDGTSTLLTNNTWEAHLTNIDIDDFFSFLPSTAQVAGEIGENTWSPITNTLDNGAGPWGVRPGISTSADWIWGSALTPGSAYGEYQVFRHQVGTAAVPEPGTMGLMGLGLLGLLGAFRKRNSGRAGK